MKCLVDVGMVGPMRATHELIDGTAPIPSTEIIWLRLFCWCHKQCSRGGLANIPRQEWIIEAPMA